MSSLQKKRDQFRFQIRKQHIKKVMEQQRKQLINSQQSEEPSLKQQIYNMTKSLIQQITHLLQQAQCDGAIKLLNYMHQIISQNQEDLTFAVNNFVQLIDFYYHLFQNKEIEPLEETIQEMQQNLSWPEIKTDSYKALVEICLNLFKKVNFQAIRKNVHLRLIDILWKIFDNNSQFGILNASISQQKSLSSFELLIIILKNSISVQINEISEKYQTMGFPNQLVSMITSSQNSSMDLKRTILQITYHYFKFQEEQYKQQQIKQAKLYTQIHIMGQTDYNRQIFLLFAIYFIEKREASQYLKCFGIIKSILSVAQYLTQKIQNEVMHFIAQKSINENPQLSLLALQLLNDIVYYSQQTTKQLVEKGFLLDIVHKKLSSQIIDFHPTRSKRVVELCSYITCNALLVKEVSHQDKKRLNTILYTHPIWQLAYQHFNDQSALFLFSAASFEYLLERMDRKQRLKFLQGYLYAVSAIDIKSSLRKQQCSIIIRTVQRNYLYAVQFWDVKQKDIMKNLFEKYKLYNLIEDFDEE